MVTYLSRSYNVWEIRTMTSTPASLASFLIAASLSFPNGSESYSIESFAIFHSCNAKKTHTVLQKLNCLMEGEGNENRKEWDKMEHQLLLPVDSCQRYKKAQNIFRH